jgi:hypothetical protein
VRCFGLAVRLGLRMNCSFCIRHEPVEGYLVNRIAIWVKDVTQLIRTKGTILVRRLSSRSLGWSIPWLERYGSWKWWA